MSGRGVGSIGQLRDLLDEHRQHPWLRILPAAAAGTRTRRSTWPWIVPCRGAPVHPTQLYSTIDALILCLLLLCYDRFRRRDGVLTALMLTIYPITRFLIERIRTDEAAIWGTGLHISQNISLGILAVAICLWIHVLRAASKARVQPMKRGIILNDPLRNYVKTVGWCQQGRNARQRLREMVGLRCARHHPTRVGRGF